MMSNRTRGILFKFEPAWTKSGETSLVGRAWRPNVQDLQKSVGVKWSTKYRDQDQQQNITAAVQLE